MDAQLDNYPLIVVLGETASGKSALSMELAKRFNGEIIAADSRTVYRLMDIGTAKPTQLDQALIPHHLIDIVNPTDNFTVFDFKDKAQRAIEAIYSKKRIPFLVGGTGLYIDALLYDYGFLPAASKGIRERLSSLSVDELKAKLENKGIYHLKDNRNPRHLIRALETNGVLPTKKALRANTLLIGLKVERDELQKRIESRVDSMVNSGLVDELKYLTETYGWDFPAMQSTGYSAFRNYLDGTATLEEAKKEFMQNDMHLAKRQRTWFKRNKEINWILNTEEAVDLVTTFLNK
jgi:tRNA dimethylallyltransferase